MGQIASIFYGSATKEDMTQTLGDQAFVVFKQWHTEARLKELAEKQKWLDNLIAEEKEYWKRVQKEHPDIYQSMKSDGVFDRER